MTELDYWEKRKNSLYLKRVAELVRVLAADSGSVLDVGSNACPYLEWFPWIHRRVSIDLRNPYRSSAIEGIQQDFLAWQSDETFDLCLCLQVLEHIPDASAFAHRLLAKAPLVIASVPYKWSADRCGEHVHDPVDEAKMADWFDREPDITVVTTEPKKSR